MTDDLVTNHRVHTEVSPETLHHLRSLRMELVREGDVERAYAVGHAITVLGQVRSCETCQHGNDADAVGFGHTYCTKPGGEWNGKLMPLVARCTGWEASS